MATARKSTKPAAPVAEVEVEVEETAPVAEPSTKAIINEGIDRFLEEAGLSVQHARYKVMRAIAFEAFSQAIANGTFDELVSDAIANADELPAGWGLERSAKEVAEKPATKAKAAAKPVAKKTPAKATPKAATARKRPTR